MAQGSHLPHLSPTLAELVDGVLGWIIGKIERREGFSAVMVSRHEEENRATHFHAETVEEGVEKALAELRGRLADARAYALAYDARVRGPEGDRPALLCRVEEVGMGRAHELVLFYQRIEGDGAVGVIPEMHLRPTGRTFIPVLE